MSNSARRQPLPSPARATRSEPRIPFEVVRYSIDTGPRSRGGHVTKTFKPHLLTKPIRKEVFPTESPRTDIYPEDETAAASIVARAVMAGRGSEALMASVVLPSESLDAELRRSKADKANKARARTRREMKNLLNQIDSVLAIHERSRPTVTRAGRRAVGKDGRSAQHILADAVQYIRDIRKRRTGTAADARARSALLGAAASWPPALGVAVLRNVPFSPPTPSLRQNDCAQWRRAFIDEDTIRSGLLSSHTMACFLVEMPGWTVLELSPGARQVGPPRVCAPVCRCECLRSLQYE